MRHLDKIITWTWTNHDLDFFSSKFSNQCIRTVKYSQDLSIWLWKEVSTWNIQNLYGDYRSPQEIRLTLDFDESFMGEAGCFLQVWTERRFWQWTNEKKENPSLILDKKIWESRYLIDNSWKSVRSFGETVKCLGMCHGAGDGWNCAYLSGVLTGPSSIIRDE